MENKAINKGALIEADLYSRPNAMNDKYKIGQLGLDDLTNVNDKDIFFLETLKMKADLADKIIAEAEAQGKDTNNPSVMVELGKKINSLGNPIHKCEAVMTAIFVSLQLMLYYGISAGIWGMVFNRGFLYFGVFGIIFGILISLLLVAPVVAAQRTRERIRNIVLGISMMWGNLGIVVGAAGLLVLIVRLLWLR